MTSSRIDIDYANLKFERGNRMHQAFIHQEIRDFTHDYDELCSYDHRTECVAALIGCAWFIGSMGTVAALVVCLAYMGLSHEFFGRADYVRQYQEKLSRLYDIYVWCIESGGKQVTSDKNFLVLAETILPLIKTEDLKKPLKDWNGISEPFKQLLLLNPIHRRPVLDDIKKSSGDILSFFRRKNADNEVVKMAITDEENSKSAVGYAKQSYAELRFFIYSRSTRRPQTWIESAQQSLPSLSLGKG